MKMKADGVGWAERCGWDVVPFLFRCSWYKNMTHHLVPWTGFRALWAADKSAAYV